jgi:hypothetical protein
MENLRPREGAVSGEKVLVSKLLLKTTPPKALVYTMGSIYGCSFRTADPKVALQQIEAPVQTLPIHFRDSARNARRAVS